MFFHLTYLSCLFVSNKTSTVMRKLDVDFIISSKISFFENRLSRSFNVTKHRSFEKLSYMNIFYDLLNLLSIIIPVSGKVSPGKKHPEKKPRENLPLKICPQGNLPPAKLPPERCPQGKLPSGKMPTEKLLIVLLQFRCCWHYLIVVNF